MLGRLAKWLRIMGYDVHYQAHYLPEEIENLVAQGRILLTRKRKWIRLVPEAILIHSDRVEGQIKELKARGILWPAAVAFSRCIRCNRVLVEADRRVLPQRVPDYVLYESGYTIKYCPTCDRYYWPGTHRARMHEQLRCWGVLS